jgi:hypothetical protein
MAQQLGVHKVSSMASVISLSCRNHRIYVHEELGAIKSALKSSLHQSKAQACFTQNIQAKQSQPVIP